MMKEVEGKEAICEIIRKESREGRLVSRPELLERLLKAGYVPEDPAAGEIEPVLLKSMEAYEDLVELIDPNGEAHYYSTTAMTEPYARILIGRKGNPLALMAEIVRENSAVYPRPVPVESFREPPFEMTEEEIRVCLAGIAEQEDLQDIRPTTTSTGALFLFSTRHLEPCHAAMLAEWLDGGPLTDP